MFWSIARVTENSAAGNTVVLLKATRREMTTTTEYHAADALARVVVRGARLIDSGESVDGYAQRRYYANELPDTYSVTANDESGNWAHGMSRQDAINYAQHLSLDMRGVTFSVHSAGENVATFTHGFRDE